MTDDTPNDTPNLAKHEWEALGKLLIPRSLGGSTTLGPNLAVKFTALGLVVYYSESLPRRPDDPPWLRMRIKVTGYRLTQRGQLLYSAWADEQPIDPEG
jgi:hypothetical protein